MYVSVCITVYVCVISGNIQKICYYLLKTLLNTYKVNLRAITVSSVQSCDVLFCIWLPQLHHHFNHLSAEHHQHLNLAHK